jgi:hypothetical protein
MDLEVVSRPTHTVPMAAPTIDSLTDDQLVLLKVLRPTMNLDGEEIARRLIAHGMPRVDLDTVLAELATLGLAEPRGTADRWARTDAGGALVGHLDRAEASYGTFQHFARPSRQGRTVLFAVSPDLDRRPPTA